MKRTTTKGSVLNLDHQRSVSVFLGVGRRSPSDRSCEEKEVGPVVVSLLVWYRFRKLQKGWIMDRILLMEEILQQLVGSFSHYLQGFIHPRWLFLISSINSMDTCEFATFGET